MTGLSLGVFLGVSHTADCLRFDSSLEPGFAYTVRCHRQATMLLDTGFLPRAQIPRSCIVPTTSGCDEHDATWAFCSRYNITLLSIDSTGRETDSMKSYFGLRDVAIDRSSARFNPDLLPGSAAPSLVSFSRECSTLQLGRSS